MATICINDTNGDGDCAQCARNPNAPCRIPASSDLNEHQQWRRRRWIAGEHLTECAVRMYPNERYPCTCRDYSPEW